MACICHCSVFVAVCFLFPLLLPVVTFFLFFFAFSFVCLFLLLLRLLACLFLFRFYLFFLVLPFPFYCFRFLALLLSYAFSVLPPMISTFLVFPLFLRSRPRARDVLEDRRYMHPSHSVSNSCYDEATKKKQQGERRTDTLVFESFEFSLNSNFLFCATCIQDLLSFVFFVVARELGASRQTFNQKGAKPKVERGHLLPLSFLRAYLPATLCNPD